MNRAAKPVKRVDYDRIASSYDRRFEGEGGRASGVLATLRDLAEELEAKRVLEVGCGTARWLADLGAEHRQLCCLDLAIGMLRRACERESRLDLVQGRAAQVAFSDASFDLITCVQAIHHFGDPRTFVGEAHRLLAAEGALAVVGSDPRDLRGSWYVYEYFQGTLETDLQRFPSWGTVLDWMVTEGFEYVEWRLVRRILDHKVGPDVLDDPFLQKNACSQLALLSDKAYAAGLRRIESTLEAAAAAGETVIFPVDIRIGALIGRSSSDKRRTRT